MLECLILGDSIAVGIATYRKDCVSVAQVGIDSAQFVAKVIDQPPLTANTTIISLGSNDLPEIKTFEYLTALRQKVKSDRVIWIFPNVTEGARDHVRQVALQFGDRILDIRNYPVAADKIHPTWEAYTLLARATKRLAMNNK